MKLIAYLTAAVVAAATLTTAPSIGATSTTTSARQHHARSSEALQVTITKIRHGIRWNRARTYYFQDRSGVHRTPTSHAERRTQSVAFLHWIHRKWSGLRVRAKTNWARHRLPYTGDWVTAVRIVQRDWPGTADWMLSCSSHEGGHGIWIWNGSGHQPYSSPYHGSGAGGWMQYLDTTFASQYASALAEARSRHLAVPPPGSQLARAGVWRESPLAQAFAAGWARIYTDSHSTWDPRVDPNCY